MFGGLFGALMGRHGGAKPAAAPAAPAMGSGMSEMPMAEKQMPSDVMGSLMGGAKDFTPPAVGNPMGGAQGMPFGNRMPRIPGGGFMGGMLGGMMKPQVMPKFGSREPSDNVSEY